jgi:hypothetical protein
MSASTASQGGTQELSRGNLKESLDKGVSVLNLVLDVIAEVILH